jgi:hypothetical protein
MKAHVLPTAGLLSQGTLAVDRDAFKTATRVELLARLELLDEPIKENVSWAGLVREMGWDATPYEKRLQVLTVTRQRYLSLLRGRLSDEMVRDKYAAGTAAAGFSRGSHGVLDPTISPDFASHGSPSSSAGVAGGQAALGSSARGLDP